jgi:phosphohistidine phosphatase
MSVYLVRHADAKNEVEDASRPLSEKGMQEVRQMASYLSRLNIRAGIIFHSGKLRAKQTAEVLSEYLRPFDGISETDGLSPLDEPLLWVKRLKDIKNPIFLVGHMPHIARLASLLVCGDAGRDIFLFRTAAIVCLKRDGAGIWHLQWMLTPDVAAGEKIT